MKNLLEQDAILFANEAFYRAFADRDVEAMNDLWSQQVPVSCIHPGWEPVFDRDEIIKSWTVILSSPGAPQIKCSDEKVNIFGYTASVICLEEMQEGTLVATNLFCREGSLWKIIHHQAGPTVMKPRKGENKVVKASMH